MVKFLKSKIFMTVIGIVLCLAISGVVIADSMPRTPVTTKLKIDYNTVVCDNYVGVGANSWISDLSNQSKELMGMTQAHFDLNAKRMATVSAASVRIMFMPHYVMFLDDADKGEEKWNDGQLNYNSDTYKSFVAQCKAHKDAGTRVMLNWGGAVKAEVVDWFGIDDVPDEQGGTRTAPDNLDAYADNLAELVYHLRAVEGLTNVDIINFHNEVSMNNFATFGDKRVIWVKMLELTHKALKDKGIRDDLTIIGVDIATNYGFEGEYGLDASDPNGGPDFYKYVYENAKDPKTGEKYYDYLSMHTYINASRYTRSIDSALHPTLGKETSLVQMLKDVTKWYPDMWLTEWAGSDVTEDIYKNDAEAKKWALENAFEVSRAGQVIVQANAGIPASYQWGYYGGYIPDPLNNVQKYEQSNTSMLYEVLWNCPTDTDSTYYRKSNGYDKVNPGFGEMGLLHKYVPKTNIATNTTAQIVKSSSESEDIRVAAFTSKTTGEKAREDVTIVVETNDDSGVKNFEINIDAKYKNKNFKKYVFEYPEIFCDGTTGTQYDANAVLTPAKNISLTGDRIVDSAEDKHYLIIYSTIDEAQQVYFKNATDVRTEIKRGESFTYSPIMSEGLENANVTNYDYSILTGKDYAEIDQTGKITVKNNAPIGEWISVKVTAKGTDVKENEAYAIALVKVLE